ncbi:MAG: ribonuclease R [Planctomycetes bacterium]|nr:ribonuclease R [Planctomycetota bacterium]
MPLRFTERILEHLAHASYRPCPAAEIRRDLRVESDDREVFRAAIDLLLEEQRIEIAPDGFVRLPLMGDEVEGSFRLNQRGFGFVIPEQRYREGDLYVPRGSTRDAITGDRVRATVLRRSGRGRGRPLPGEVTGRVEEVLERGQEHFVGALRKRGREWYVEPDGRRLHDPVLIRDPHAKNAKEGDKVVIELLHYPEEEYYAEGVILRVLGEAGRPDVETSAVIAAHGLRVEFPDAATAEAQRAATSFAPDEAHQREDLTEQFIFTIDPPDAKDFDDAISITQDEQEGEWTLGVHIADVGHFVSAGGALDEEAKARGNSVYLPRLVIPMLPETLSNGVCSLQEGVPRFAKSVFITLDARGRVLSQRVAATVIKSAKRLTYLEAQALLDGDEREARRHAKTSAAYGDELVAQLRSADRLARVLQRRRHRDGMIVLNLPDVDLVFDDDGHVVDAVPEDDAFTHKLIEMFMVEANEALARLFDSLLVPMIRRIHPEPRFGDLEELRMYARAAQQSLPDEPNRHDLQKLLDATRTTPAARAIHFAVLRTLTKATYSPAGIGHFALASDHYTHFTSPIRRYPDLVVHRALEAYLELTDNGRNVPGGRKRDALARNLRDDARVPDEGALITLGRHCSDTEGEAAAAERELRDFLVMQLLHEKHLGDEFPGVITGVTNAGVFVSIEQYLVEGLVPLADLPAATGRPDRWKVDEATGRMVARRSGAVLGIGDVVTVQVVKVDLASRHLDLRITEFPDRAAAEPVAPAAGSRSRRERVKGKGKGYKQGRRGRRG